MAFLIGGANSAADTAFSVANSCRFTKGDNAYLSKSLGAPTDADKFTVSYWIKLGDASAATRTFFNINNGSSVHTFMQIKTDHVMIFGRYASGYQGNLTTNQVFRDHSAWYNVVQVYDSGNATAGNRMRWYVNGAEVTLFSTDTNPSEDLESYWNSSGSIATIGSFRSPDGSSNTGTSSNGDYYLAEFVFCDGQAYTPSDFGEYDEDSPTIWKPKDVSGLTFGNNGFYLDFEDSSNLGNDKNGGTDFTEVNIAAADQATDTPTNNFCVMNPLDNHLAAGTFSEGNCQVATNAGNTTWGTSTFGLSKGCWYYEVKFPSGSVGGGETMGIIDRPTASTSASPYNGSSAKNAIWRSGGDLYINDSNNTDFTPSGGDLWVADNIMGVYIDLDNSKIYCSINGVMKNSGTGVSITAISSTINGVYFPTFGDSNSASTTFQFNFGGCSAFAISSAASDANNYGNFEYSPTVTVDGSTKSFYAICTKNLAEYG